MECEINEMKKMKCDKITVLFTDAFYMKIIYCMERPKKLHRLVLTPYHWVSTVFIYLHKW
jgi:hypothetical protein